MFLVPVPRSTIMTAQLAEVAGQKVNTAVELIAGGFTSIAFTGTGQTHARDRLN